MGDKMLTLHIFCDDMNAEGSWRLIQWCMDKGADEFTLTGIYVAKQAPPPSADESSPAGLHVGKQAPSPSVFDIFDAEMENHRLPASPRYRLYISREGDGVRETELWRLDEATVETLKKVLPDGAFTYCCDDAWFEDLTLYRGGELMLGIVSHEGEGVLRVSPSERTELDEEAIPYRLKGEWVGYPDA